MIYSLRWDTEVYPAFTALPERTRHAFGAALVEAQADPVARTSPYGHDDGTMRMLMLGKVLAVLLIGDQSKSITVVQISHVG